MSEGPSRLSVRGTDPDSDGYSAGDPARDPNTWTFWLGFWYLVISTFLKWFFLLCCAFPVIGFAAALFVWDIYGAFFKSDIDSLEDLHSHNAIIRDLAFGFCERWLFPLPTQIYWGVTEGIPERAWKEVIHETHVLSYVFEWYEIPNKGWGPMLSVFAVWVVLGNIVVASIYWVLRRIVHWRRGEIDVETEGFDRTIFMNMLEDKVKELFGKKKAHLTKLSTEERRGIWRVWPFSKVPIGVIPMISKKKAGEKSKALKIRKNSMGMVEPVPQPKKPAKKKPPWMK
ncbi:hypothetical protein B0O99DRAFT_32245 [Bisporella sp. PMI_857]|nr:hypothetical protein B0O99DRAFT_32245 [Bisporella sp. PMI_857]